MTDCFTSSCQDYENPSGWEELEKRIIYMQDFPESEGSSSYSSDYDDEVMRAVQEDDCVKQMLMFFKEEIRAVVYKYAPSSVKSFLTKDELKCNVRSDIKEWNSKEKDSEKPGFWGKLWDSLKNFIYNIKEAMKSFWNSIIDILKNIINIIKGVIVKLFERVDELMKKFYSSVNEAAEKGANMVTELLFNQIKDVLNAYMKASVHAHKM